MFLMINCCLHTSHFFIKCLAFYSRMSGYVELFCPFFFCPLFGCKKKSFSDTAVSHILRNVNGCKIQVLVFFAKEFTQTSNTAFKLLNCKCTLYKTAGSNRFLQAIYKKQIILFCPVVNKWCILYEPLPVFLTPALVTTCLRIKSQKSVRFISDSHNLRYVIIVCHLFHVMLSKFYSGYTSLSSEISVRTSSRYLFASQFAMPRFISR